jgi:hypothetical protein
MSQFIELGDKVSAKLSNKHLMKAQKKENENYILAHA